MEKKSIRHQDKFVFLD